MTFTIQIGSWKQNYRIVLTDAVKDYDYHGSFEVYDYGTPITSGPITKHNARIVALRVENAEYQIGRYRSGLNAVWNWEQFAGEMGLTETALEKELVRKLYERLTGQEA